MNLICSTLAPNAGTAAYWNYRCLILRCSIPPKMTT